MMSLPRTKRVKYLAAAGDEVFQEDDRWHFLRAADPTAQARGSLATQACARGLWHSVATQRAAA